MCLTPFQCFNADRPRHLLDTRIVCDGDHSTWQWIGVAGFIIYSCGIPLGFLGLMTWSKRRDQLAIPDVQAMVAFLQSGLEPRLHQFECIFMFRKVLFLLILYLVGESAASKIARCYCLMAVAGLFLLIHVTFSPYDNWAYFLLDKIEGASLMAVFATLIGQIGLWSAADPITSAKPSNLRASRQTMCICRCNRLPRAVLAPCHLGFLATACSEIFHMGASAAIPGPITKH